jgi:hypothetical protein
MLFVYGKIWYLEVVMKFKLNMILLDNVSLFIYLFIKFHGFCHMEYWNTS